MCGWPSTSDPSCLITGLRRQPLLAVLRPSSIHQARRQLEQLRQAGLCHAELAVEASSDWVAMARELVAEAYKRATAVLTGNRKVLDDLAEMLVERETVDAEDLQELLISSDVRVAEYV